ncbi:MAG: cysteine hydrolase [Clostridia bacterium]|nr:cysteine hydrolase [Clostridia bacterium]
MKMLIVVDMVNGFVNEGALADNNINKITPTIVSLIERAKQKGVKVVAFRDCHEPNDVEFQSFPPHCIKGTTECELIPEIKRFEDQMIVIDKPTTNGYNTQEFRRLLTHYDVDSITVCGCCTDICVENLVNSLLRFNKLNDVDCDVNVVENACYTFDSPTHNAQREHNMSIERMFANGAKIVDFYSESENIR